MTKGNLLSRTSMTPMERAAGRFMRAPDHPGGDGGAEGGAAADDAAPAVEGTQEDFSEFEDSLDDNGDDNDSGDDANPATPPADDDPQGKPPEPEDKGASVEERIGELTAARREAEREREQERVENQRLRERLERLERGEKPGEPQKKERGPDDAPNPDDYEFGEADGKYLADIARYEARQEFRKETQTRELQQELQQVETRWTEAIASEELKGKYADFDEKVTKGADRGDWDLSPIGSLLVKESPVGPDVAYHLATNAAESKRIAQLSPFEQAREIGRLEGRFLDKPKAPPAKAVTDAPPPPQRSRGAGGKFEVAADTEDFAAFDKKADAILAAT